MAYDKHIDKTEEELCKLRDVCSKNEVDRFTDGLESGRINSEEKVIELTNYIRASDGLTQLEYIRLQRLYNEGFIEKFATNYNKRYSTCNLLMNKMRSGISRGMHMLEKLSSKKRSHGSTKSKRRVIDNSKMGNSPYNSALWGLEQYKESVRVLYNEIVSYENHITQCIDLCLYIIEQVAYIRSHPETAYEKHLKNRQEILQNNRSVIRRFVEMNAEMENDLMEKVEALKQQKKSMQEISAMLYHTLDENEYNDWVISEEVMAARRQGITNQERALWGDDKQQVMLCRTAYSHLDELHPEGQKEHIGGKFIALLHNWSKVMPSRGLEYWLTYFTDFYKNSGGVLTPVKKGAVKRGLAQILKGEIEKKEVDEFNQMMDNMVKKYMIKSSDHKNSMQNAVNF
ncbi:hypothetical protein SAMN05216354_2397 [Xylanibacter ruminicola]|uniref:Uncharacterized protein n=1 Tax=Xylanibacter ruminicola TaxID=839 RepID=A0A1H5WLI4_XYLRU|nr:hypothetical protein [Xylanibacter ruminicola]SEF99817.1 hypothetical protein SAMN05216354_2397 [Xylanibacter ruminicola]